MSSSQCNTQQPASVEYDNPEQPVDYKDRTKAHEGHDSFLYEAEYQPTVNTFRITPNSNRGVHQGHHKRESSGEDNSQEGNRTWNSVGLGLGGESKINRRQRLSITDRILKRRDQNRVAQRAYRQKKEKYIKDLKAKLVELEQLLETASQNNSIFCRHLGRLEEELRYYRRPLFANASLSQSSSDLPSLSYITSSNPATWIGITSSLGLQETGFYNTATDQGINSKARTTILSNSTSPDLLQPIMMLYGDESEYVPSKNEPPVPRTIDQIKVERTGTDGEDGFWEEDPVQDWRVKGYSRAETPARLQFIPVDMIHNGLSWPAQQKSWE